MLKRFLKRFFIAIAIVVVSPLIILTWLEKFIETSTMGRQRGYFYISCRELFSIIPTLIGNYLRLGYYMAVCNKVSPDATISFGTILGHRGVTIGPGVNTGPFSIIGYATIEENVLMAARVSIISGKYQHGRPSERSRGDEMDIGGHNELITIGRNTWIGQDAVILANIGRNCTVGAGSVVYRDVPDGATVLGNPARKVNMDSRDN